LGTPTDAFYGPNTLSISPDASRTALEHTETTDRNIWIEDLARGGQTRLTYSKSGQDEYPAWSPDGTSIAF